MSKPSSKRLVIDASIAKQAGGKGGPKPASVACRSFLMAILSSRIGHTMALSPAIAAEWKKHAAGYARSWLSQMYARKRVIPIEGKVTPGLEQRALAATPYAANPAFNAKDVKDKEALKKDLHLIYAALDADKLIASLDEVVRNLLISVAPKVNELCQIAWVNPDSDPTCVAWLEQGCAMETKKLIKS